MATMPFGKDRGRPLTDIDTDYLIWVMSVVTSAWLRDAIRDELRARRERSRPTPPGAGADTPALDLIESGRRALARKYHPDINSQGGEFMEGVNALVEWGRERLHGRR